MWLKGHKWHCPLFAGNPLSQIHIFTGALSIFPAFAGWSQANCPDNNYHESFHLQPSTTTSWLLCLSLPIVSSPSSVLQLPYCHKTHAVCFGFVLPYHSSFSTNSCSSYIKVYMYVYTHIHINFYTHTYMYIHYIYHVVNILTL